MANGEIAYKKKQFLHLPQCFQLNLIIIIPFKRRFSSFMWALFKFSTAARLTITLTLFDLLAMVYQLDHSLFWFKQCCQNCLCGRQCCSGRSVGLSYQRSRDERVQFLRIFPYKRRENWLSLQEADIERY